MIDPGALGTLLIGLDRVRREQEYIPTPTHRATRRSGHRDARRLIADSLHHLAEMLAPQSRPRDVSV